VIKLPHMKSNMGKRSLRLGDKVRVVKLPKMTFPPGLKDELGTVKLFKRMLGRVYTVRGFDPHGWVELNPTRRDAVWMHPEELRRLARKTKSRK